MNADDAMGVLQSYHLDAVEVQSEVATIYRVTPLHDKRVVAAGCCPAIGRLEEAINGPFFDDDIAVGATVFLGIVNEAIPATGDPWKTAQRLIRQAARLIDPGAAGFPEWNRIYADDPYVLDRGEAGGRPWAAFQVTTYRRQLAKAKAAARKPQNFSAAQRRALLRSARHQCQRCGSGEKLEVDHIVPVSHGGTDAEHNGMVLCRECHREKSSAERHAFGLTLDGVGSSCYRAHRQDIARCAADPERYLTELEQRTGFSLVGRDRRRVAG